MENDIKDNIQSISILFIESVISLDVLVWTRCCARLATWWVPEMLDQRSQVRVQQWDSPTEKFSRCWMMLAGSWYHTQAWNCNRNWIQKWVHMLAGCYLLLDEVVRHEGWICGEAFHMTAKPSSNYPQESWHKPTVPGMVSLGPICARFRRGAGFSLLHYWVVYGQPFWVCQRWSKYSGICPFERSNSADEVIVARYVWNTDLGTCQTAVSRLGIMSFKRIAEIWYGLWIIQDTWEDCACAMFWICCCEFFILWRDVARKHKRCFRRRNCWHPTSNI